MSLIVLLKVKEKTIGLPEQADSGCPGRRPASYG
jgi:hypothetical protein